jgi:protein TonB
MTSMIVHGVIIALVVRATAQARVAPPFVGDPVIPIIPQPPAEQPTTHHGRSGGPPGRTGTDVPRIPDPGATIDVARPATDPVTTRADADAGVLAEISGGGSPSAGVVPGGVAPASEPTLDTPVRVITERAPAYPDVLRAAGIGGIVRVRFVVDTTGRAEPSSIRILDSSHELFTRAVLATLRQTRFTPGELAGRRVRTLVERSYRFDVAAPQQGTSP